MYVCNYVTKNITLLTKCFSRKVLGVKTLKGKNPFISCCNVVVQPVELLEQTFAMTNEGVVLKMSRQLLQVEPSTLLMKNFVSIIY